MKKILNNPSNFVDEMLDGLCAAHPEFYKRTGPAGRVIVRPDAPIEGKVGIVTGGGSGHLPIFTGYVGEGLLGRNTHAGHLFGRFAPPQQTDDALGRHQPLGVRRILEITQQNLVQAVAQAVGQHVVQGIVDGHVGRVKIEIGQGFEQGIEHAKVTTAWTPDRLHVAFEVFYCDRFT